MDYSELKKIAETRNIMIKDLASKLGFTPNGFKVSIENETFPIGKVKELCGLLKITAAQFFGEETIDTHSSVCYKQHGSHNTIAAEGSVVSSASEVEFLRQQVKELTEIVKALSK